MIPVLQPTLLGEEALAVAEVLDSAWWGDGPRVAEFERSLAERTGRKHCIAVNSCTAALHLAVLGHEIGPGDEIIVPALTFISTALAVEYAGATPVFADVRPETLTIDWDDVARKRTARTKAVIPVDYAGYPAMEPGSPQTGLPIIQDAAHHNGGLCYGETVCYSFHPVKNLATPDGGAILTDDEALAERLRALRWCGINRSTWARSGKRYSWDYDIQQIGYKCHWNDVAAAIGLVQLRHLKELNDRRRALAWRYNTALRAVVQVPQGHERHTHHLYAIRVQSDRRDALVDYLADRGISASVHYKPLSHYRMWDQDTPPVTEREWQRLVTLPLYAHMTEAEQDTVIEAVRAFMECK